MDQGPNQGDSRNTSVNHSIYDYTVSQLTDISCYVLIRKIII